MRVVIIGGGFAGIKAARKLSKRFEVILVEQNDCFTFKPLLPEFIVGSIPYDTVCFPIKESTGPNIAHIRGIAKEIDTELKQIHVLTTDNSATIKVPYDYLLVTTGAIPNDFNVKGVIHPYDIQNALIMKEQMRNIIKRIMNQEKISVGIVGAGPVGVEIAFVVRDFMNFFSKKYHNSNIHTMTLYNSSDDILSNFSHKMASLTRSQLIMNGIKVENHCLVRQIDQKDIGYNLHYQRDNKPQMVKQDIVFWAAGIEKSKIGNMTFETDRFLRSKHNKFIFAAGDAAKIDLKKRRVPELAQLALHQGEFVAENIIRASSSRKLKPYRVRLKGLMLLIGHQKQIGIIGRRIVLRGFFAWWISRFIYIFQITSFKRKMYNLNVWSNDIFNKKYGYIDSEDESIHE